MKRKVKYLITSLNLEHQRALEKIDQCSKPKDMLMRGYHLGRAATLIDIIYRLGELVPSKGK